MVEEVRFLGLCMVLDLWGMGWGCTAARRAAGTPAGEADSKSAARYHTDGSVRRKNRVTMLRMFHTGVEPA